VNEQLDAAIAATEQVVLGQVRSSPALRPATEAVMGAITGDNVADSWPRLRYLAALLDRAGARSHATELLDRTRQACAGSTVEVEVLNLQAMITANDGRYREAAFILEQAFDKAINTVPSTATAVGTNLVAVLRLGGELNKAALWTRRVAELVDPEVSRPVAETSAGLLAALARGRASGGDDPSHYVDLATVALDHFESARSRVDAARMREAHSVLESAAQLLGVLLGADDPRALVATANSTVCGFEVALHDIDQDRIGKDRIGIANQAVQRSWRRLRSALGERAPQAVVMGVSAAVAEIEYARVERSVAALEAAVFRLGAAGTAAARVLGETHPAHLLAVATLAACRFDLACQERRAQAIGYAGDGMRSAVTTTALMLGEDHPTTRALKRQLRLCERLEGGGSAPPSRGGSVTVLTRTATDGHEWNCEYGFLEEAERNPDESEPLVPHAPSTTESATTYYRHAGIVVTEQWFIAGGRRFSISELRNLRTARGPHHQLTLRSLGAAGAVALCVGAVGVTTDLSRTALLWLIAVLAVPLLAASIGHRLHPRAYELWCEFRGMTILLLRSNSERHYGQITRALLRAREAARYRER
jgi:hypothetical protein